MFKRIVLGLDGSEESTRALEFAKQLATSEDAHVEIVHVHEYMIAGRAGMQPVRVDEDELEAIVRRQAEELKSDGVDAHLTIVSTSAGGRRTCWPITHGPAMPTSSSSAREVGRPLRAACWAA